MSLATLPPAICSTVKTMAKKKEKITYVDDGRTLADMSGVSGGRLPKRPAGVPGSTAKEKWQTYWGAVKMMFVPMLTVVVALCVIYMIIWVIFFFMA